ncbi:LLM class flavin-dependent oxidoreductase [Dactylosporangium fulvum]|uniref:LLM class flavin-dependent oxidoreductase n=1 Tax=Dactylosporangium fulvum TaxID=53359 RepID=A0ABY5VNS2_9ACTN|nr:LLM class flavin-dependent oxidoreductase [Dactylosporangium fulvum]UWP78681.1 LLM class flavin-dependent oxidoreductase [Dactylosporangium fulvum]
MKVGYFLGVGTGEALDEHIYGDAWPSADERLEMLEEAVWDGGSVTHRGKHHTVDQAQVHTSPETPPRVSVSALDLAGRIADGFMSTQPNAEHVEHFRKAGDGDKPAQGGFKGCYAASEDEAARIAHRLWPNSGLPGELSQVLPSPKHVEQASSPTWARTTPSSSISTNANSFHSFLPVSRVVWRLGRCHRRGARNENVSTSRSRRARWSADVPPVGRRRSPRGP